LDALDALGEPWTGGPFSEPTRMALHDHQQEVRNSLTSLDALSQAVASSGPDLVITHGEPHPGNLIRTQSVVALIDWDTVALAPRERDLWMFDDGTPDALSIYEDLTEHKLNHTAMSFYRLAWELFDMASFIEMFRSAHQRSQWIEQKWVVLHGLLAGAPSDPFGLQGGVCTTP
jgi:spectinomycin phosphotransferase